MKRRRWLAPLVVCLAPLVVFIVLPLALPPVAHPARLDAMQRGVMAPLATPAPGMPLTLDTQQAQEVAVLIEFIQAYNAGRVSTALSLFGPPWHWSDCDYRHVVVLVGQDETALRRWLQQRAADHDRLDIGSITVGTVQEQVLGVAFKRRTSDTLRALGRPQGIAPALSAKVIFDGRAGLTARPSIAQFANGPYGGSLDSCRVRP